MPGRTADISTSSFRPLELQEIMMVPLAKQKMEDEFLEESAKLGQLSADTLGTDSDKAQKIITDFKDRVGGLSQEILDRGVSREQFNKLRGLKGEVASEFGAEGFLGKAIANKKAANEYINKMATDKIAQAGWSPKEAQQWAMHQVSQFKGTEASDGSFNTFQGRQLATKVDEDKFLKEAVDSVAEEINPIAMQMANVGGLPAFKQAFQDGKVTSKDFNRVMEAILTKSMNNPELLASLEQQAFFTGEENPLDMGHFKYKTVVDENTGKEKTVREFVMGKSRFGRKAAGIGSAGSYRNLDVDTTILKDEIGLKMYVDGMDERQAIELIQFIDGEANQVNPTSLESTRENLKLYGQEVQTYKRQADARRSELEAQGMTEDQINNDFKYKQFQNNYINKNTAYKNAEARMNTIFDVVDSRLDPDDKKIFEAKEALEKYDGDYIAALKGEFGKTISKEWLKGGYQRDEEHAAAISFAKHMGIDMNKGDRSRGDLIKFPYMVQSAEDRRTDLAEDYLEANPQAEYFTRLNGESTGKYYTAIGGWNKTQSENFSVEGATLAYNGGTLEENKDYQDILVEGEIPKFRVEMTDGYDDGGNSFNNVIITTSKGSTSVQVIDNMNGSARQKIANQLMKGDYQQRKMGEQLLADMHYMNAVKKSGMTWQDEGSMNVGIGAGKTGEVKYTKDSDTGFYTATMFGIPLELDGRQHLAGEKEMSLAIYKEVQEMEAARQRNQNK